MIPARAIFSTVLVSSLLFFASNPVDILAADPPYVPPPPAGYVTWDDNLIPQKLGQIFSADPDPYVKQGRFYDVGRNPAPISPPAAVQPTDYGDWRFRVTHIKFDWKPNGDTGYDEAQTMMFDKGENLDHVEDGKVKGEWIYKYANFDKAAGRSEPALYVAGKDAVVQVRIESANPVKYAYVGAKELRAPYLSGGTPSAASWLDVKKTAVPFRETSPGSDIWVSYSRVQVGDDEDGNPIYEESEYVNLELDGTIKSVVDRSDIVWQWYVDQVNNTNELAQANPINEWTAAVVCLGTKDGWAINKSGEYATQELVDDEGNTTEVEVVLPHRFYTILDKSKYPWYDQVDGSNAEGQQGNQKPWAKALDFAIVDAGKIELRGYGSISAVAERVAEFFYADFGLFYAHNGGVAKWVYTAGHTSVPIYAPVSVFEFYLSECLAGVNSKVNCHDLALAVATLTALIGGEAKYTSMEPFGYVNPSDFIGTEPRGNNCDNPFFDIVGVYASDGNVGDDDTIWRFGPAPALLRKRSLFSVHAWMELSNLVYDATAGAAGSGSPRTGLTRANFKTAAIDLSHTAVNPWEDNEEMAVEVDQFGAIQGPKKESGSNNPDPDYKNGDMSKAAYGTFTLN
jgi:hypothetical protein